MQWTPHACSISISPKGDVTDMDVTKMCRSSAVFVPVVPVAILFVALGLGGCDQGRIAKLEQQQQAMQAQLTQMRQAGELDLQAKCSTVARDYLAREWPSGDPSILLLTQTNHYNRTQNKCFILIEYHFKLMGEVSWFNTMMVRDVYENTKYAELRERHTVDGVQVGFCEVAGTKCQSVEDFRRLTTDYMTK